MIGNSALKEGEWDRHSRPPHAVPRWHDAHNFARGRTLPARRSVWPFTATALMPRHKSVRPSVRPFRDLFGKGPSSLRSALRLRDKPAATHSARHPLTPPCTSQEGESETYLIASSNFGRPSL